VAKIDLAEVEVVETNTVRADDTATLVAEASGPSEREELVRRRWRETGIRMWNPKVHGAGQSALCIQGRIALLPPKAGETMPQYEKLEFRLIEGRIECDGFVVDPPEPPRASSI